MLLLLYNLHWSKESSPRCGRRWSEVNQARSRVRADSWRNSMHACCTGVHSVQRDETLGEGRRWCTVTFDVWPREEGLRYNYIYFVRPLLKAQWAIFPLLPGKGIYLYIYIMHRIYGTSAGIIEQAIVWVGVAMTWWTGSGWGVGGGLRKISG